MIVVETWVGDRGKRRRVCYSDLATADGLTRIFLAVIVDLRDRINGITHADVVWILTEAIRQFDRQYSAGLMHMAVDLASVHPGPANVRAPQL